jgi:hypothetical protein
VNFEIRLKKTSEIKKLVIAATIKAITAIFIPWAIGPGFNLDLKYMAKKLNVIMS